MLSSVHSLIAPELYRWYYVLYQKEKFIWSLSGYWFRKDVWFSWTFLNKALLAFNFGQSFIKWVNMFYFNIQSCVMNNSFSSAHFDVKRGVWQGDPLSPYLFIIALETQTVYVRGSLKALIFEMNVKLN